MMQELNRVGQVSRGCSSNAPMWQGVPVATLGLGHARRRWSLTTEQLVVEMVSIARLATSRASVRMFQAVSPYFW